MSAENELPAGSIPLSETIPLAVGPGLLEAKRVYQSAAPIEIELPNGRKIGMAKPNISLSEKIASVLQNVSYKDPTAMGIEQQRVKSLLHITDIDGVSEPKISDPIMRAALEQKIGDEFLDAIFLTWIENFPPVDASVLKITKKS